MNSTPFFYFVQKNWQKILAKFLDNFGNFIGKKNHIAVKG